MNFKISRASYYNINEKPCNEAKQLIDDSWYVEINTIEQLIEFTKKYGRCIVAENHIKIYDDYIE